LARLARAPRYLYAHHVVASRVAFPDFFEPSAASELGDIKNRLSEIERTKNIK
jgi:hypothetical protein